MREPLSELTPFLDGSGHLRSSGQTKKALPAYWYMAGKIAAGRQICAPELSVRESGSTLPEDAAMHTLPENGVLRIHFCASGA